jgi:hypothetical protein
MKGCGLLFFGRPYRAWELTELVIALLCLGIADVSLGSLAHAPIPPDTGPVMRSQMGMASGSADFSSPVRSLPAAIGTSNFRVTSFRETTPVT